MKAQPKNALKEKKPQNLGKSQFKNKNKQQNKNATKDTGKLPNGNISKAKNKGDKPNKLSKLEKKSIESQSDNQVESISQEVGELLEILKMEKAVASKTSKSNNVAGSSENKKKQGNKNKKNKNLPVPAIKTENSENVGNVNIKQEDKASKKRKLDNKVNVKLEPGKVLKKEKDSTGPEIKTEDAQQKGKKIEQVAGDTEKPKQSAKPAKKKQNNVKTGSTNILNGVKSEEQKTEHRLKNAVPVYVGNLPVNIRRKRLINQFKKFGEIQSLRFRTNDGRHIKNKADLLKKTPFIIAFMYMKNMEEAKACLAANGEKIGENVITVDLDTELKDKEHYKPKNTVFVGNLKYAVTDQILRETFKCCGEVNYIRVLQAEKGCNGTAFVSFAKPEGAALALNLDKTLILDREVHIEPYRVDKIDKKVKKDKKDKTLTGAARRLAKTQGKKGFQKSLKPKGVEKKDKKNTTEDKKGKKSKEFLGAKSNDTKKKFNKKKAKVTGMKLLAKKIAPKGSA